MKFQNYHIADSEVVGIGPLKRVPAGDYFSTQMMLRFDLITKQQVIKMDSEPVHYTDSLESAHPEFESFRISYNRLRQQILEKIDGERKELCPTLNRQEKI